MTCAPTTPAAPAATEVAVPGRPDVDPRWHLRAACRRDPRPDRWVDLPPVRVGGVNNPNYDTRLAELRQLCGLCPVRAHCLWDALDHSVRGVFAGTDEYERADLRDLLGLPTPPSTAAENEEDARMLRQQFEALRLARRGYTNTQIALTLGVSAMTVSRLVASDEHPAPRRSKPAAAPDPA